MQATRKACFSTACYYRYLLQNREQDKEEWSSVKKFTGIINRIFQYIYILNTEFSAYEFRCGNKFSCMLYISLAASTDIPLFWLADKASRALFCYVLAFYFNSDNLGRVVYANIVTISQKKWCSLINTNKILLSAPSLLLSAPRPLWLWTRTKDPTTTWHWNCSLFVWRNFSFLFPRVYLQNL